MHRLAARHRRSRNRGSSVSAGGAGGMHLRVGTCMNDTVES